MTNSRLSVLRLPACEAGVGGHFEPHVPGIRCGVLDELVDYSVRRAQIAI